MPESINFSDHVTVCKKSEVNFNGYVPDYKYSNCVRNRKYMRKLKY